MEVKLFEVRDRATFLPCIGILLSSSESKEAWLLKRAGFSDEYPHVMFGRMSGGAFNYDVFNWPPPSRTMQEAHRYVADNWAKLKSGDVIDVEYALGETLRPKASER